MPIPKDIPLLRSGLAWSQRKICSHSPSKGSLWVCRKQCTRFLRSCSWYRLCNPASGPEAILVRRSIPAAQLATEKTRRGAGGVSKTSGKQPAAQRKTACCNSAICWKRRMGSSACDTSRSSCCLSAGKTPDRSNRCSGVLAGSYTQRTFLPSRSFDSSFIEGSAAIDGTVVAPDIIQSVAALACSPTKRS